MPGKHKDREERKTVLGSKKLGKIKKIVANLVKNCLVFDLSFY